MNNKDIAILVLIILTVILNMALISLKPNGGNEVTIRQEASNPAHIEIDDNLIFNGYSWIENTLIIRYKEKE